MKTNQRSRRALTVVAGIASLAAVFTGTAAGAAYITSADIQNQTITSADIGRGGVGGSEVRDQALHSSDLAPDSVGTSEVRNGAIAPDDLSTDTKAAMKGDKGDKGDPGLSDLEADGPYPGATDLGDLGTNGSEGDNSDESVPADGTRHTVWVQCATGKVALGGGFRLAADSTQQAAQDIDVLASEPTQVENGQLVVDPIPGDAADSIQPNGWQVEVVNNGDTAQTVRPWVTCAKIAG